MNTIYSGIHPDFYNEIEKVINQRTYTKIRYFSEIREYLSVTSLIKEIILKEEEGFALLANGTEIRLDRIISIDQVVSPDYPDYALDFSCDC